MADIANVADSNDEIKITPEMIEAGTQAMSDNWYRLKDYCDRETYRDVAIDVYKQMRAAQALSCP